MSDDCVLHMNFQVTDFKSSYLKYFRFGFFVFNGISTLFR